jgi:CheY-like chemotaxis protein
MNHHVVVLVAEDDPGHAVLVERNLRRAGLVNDIRVFADGQEILDFLFGDALNAPELRDTQYLLLLDIRMPKVDGTEVLRRVKSDVHLRRIPCVMLTTTDDPLEIDKCHRLGCNSYVVKPLGADRFIETVRRLGLFLSVVEVPSTS